MIPGDLASRLRLLAESAVNPLAAVRGIPQDLPEHESGQRFTARIVARQADGNYRALVGDRPVTLSMQTPAQPGDVLDLVIVERTPRAIVAALADSTDSHPGMATLSRTAKMIGELLGAVPPKPAPLDGGRPLLPAPPMPGHAAAIAPRLEQAISESGMFFEAHQALWASGRFALDRLMREPQAKFPLAPTPATPGGGTAATPSANTPPASVSAAPQVPGSAVRPALSTASEAALAEHAPANGRPALPHGAGHPAVIPEAVAPIVQRQLEALATHQIAWIGTAWPGQTIEWNIEEPGRDPDGGDGGRQPRWNTSLRLTLPLLGGLNARLSIAGSTVDVAIEADRAPIEGRLRAAGPELAAALAAAGLSLGRMRVTHRER